MTLQTLRNLGVIVPKMGIDEENFIIPKTLEFYISNLLAQKALKTFVIGTEFTQGIGNYELNSNQIFVSACKEWVAYWNSTDFSLHLFLF